MIMRNLLAEIVLLLTVIAFCFKDKKYLMDLDDYIKDAPFTRMEEETQKILVVDDDSSIRNLLGQFLERKGFNYSTAENGKKALELLEDHNFTIIITDLIMPQVDGLELLKIVKQSWPDIDVLVMTGYTKNFTYTDVIYAGASDFVQKPFSLDEIEAKLNRIIRERQLRHALRRISIRDGLTDLYNRRFFDQKIQEEAARALRQKYPLFLLMMDLDNFKSVNDEEGHQAGDRILNLLARTLERSTRKNVDLTFRFGGDEFAVLIPYASQEHAEAIAERIRTNFLKEDVGSVTISLGLACLGEGDDVGLLTRQLVADADNALYSAKKEGGNMLVVKAPA